MSCGFAKLNQRTVLLICASLRQRVEGIGDREARQVREVLDFARREVVAVREAHPRSAHRRARSSVPTVQPGQGQLPLPARRRRRKVRSCRRRRVDGPSNALQRLVRRLPCGIRPSPRSLSSTVMTQIASTAESRSRAQTRTAGSGASFMNSETMLVSAMTMRSRTDGVAQCAPAVRVQRPRPQRPPSGAPTGSSVPASRRRHPGWLEPRPRPSDYATQPAAAAGREYAHPAAGSST